MTGNSIAIERDEFYPNGGSESADSGGRAMLLADYFFQGLHWGWGLLLCALGAAILQGLASGFPAIPGPVPFTVTGTAVVVISVSLFTSAQWGPIFAACVGLNAGATGSGLPGVAALAYILLPLFCAVFRDMIRRKAVASFVVFVCLQSLFQTTGSYLGRRLEGGPVIPCHRAMLSIALTVLVTTVLTAVVRGGAAVLWRSIVKVRISDRWR